METTTDLTAGDTICQCPGTKMNPTHSDHGPNDCGWLAVKFSPNYPTVAICNHCMNNC